MLKVIVWRITSEPGAPIFWCCSHEP